MEDFLGPNGALEGLEKVLRAGKARFTGFTLAGGTLEPALKLAETGRFNLINVAINLLSPTERAATVQGTPLDSEWRPLVEYAHTHNVGISIINPLAGGYLTEAGIAGSKGHPLARDRRGDTEELPVPYRKAQALSFLSKPDRTMSQAGIRFLLMQPGITTVLGGFSAKEQVEENVTNSGAPGLSQEEMMRVDMVWRANFGLPRE